MADGHMRRTSAQEKWSASPPLVCFYAVDRHSLNSCTEKGRNRWGENFRHKGNGILEETVVETWRDYFWKSNKLPSMREKQSKECRQVINFCIVNQSLVWLTSKTLVLLAVLNLSDVY